MHSAYDWKPVKVDWEKFREWHSTWLADYIEKHGRLPAQVKLNDNHSH